jgi:hypothetical protein
VSNEDLLRHALPFVLAATFTPKGVEMWMSSKANMIQFDPAAAMIMALGMTEMAAT